MGMTPTFLDFSPKRINLHAEHTLDIGESRLLSKPFTVTVAVNIISSESPLFLVLKRRLKKN